MAPPPEAIVLTDQLNLPARDPRQVRSACNPRFDLVGKDLVQLREDLSSVRGGDRIQRMEECIRGSLRGDYLVQLLSGHPGSGKSTELRWLAGELQNAKDGQLFHTVLVDLQEYIDIRDIQLPEFITAIFSAIIDDSVLGPYARTTTTAKKIWKEVLGWVKETGISLESDIPLGVAKLKLSLKTSPGLQKRYRIASRDHIVSLMEGLGDLIQDVRSHLIKQGVADLVIIADNLERIELMKPALRLTRADIDDVVKEFVGNMERLLQGRPFLAELPHIVKTGSFPGAFNDDVRQWLLYELVVLEYNGDTWYDVHPFARRTHAFIQAGKVPEQS